MAAGKGTRRSRHPRSEPAVKTRTKPNSARADSRPSRHYAYSLVELLVYMGVAAILLGLGFVAVNRCATNSWIFRSELDDFSRAMFAGERWRADIRSAQARPRVETSSGEQLLHIPTGRGEVTYRISTNSVLRRVGQGQWLPVLAKVRSSTMELDARNNVSAWRWELELEMYAPRPWRVRPLFTFVAVPHPNNP